ncbi:putative peptidyl-prolyl cis-trans isomerase Cbf2 precursor [bacterium BMS3Bbin07]|nr:putative peptidyl-prolyl cis-trans isomerase Cbf2 precursor [bacterium BMS3Bbin07]
MKTLAKFFLILLVIAGCTKTPVESKAPADYIAKVDGAYIMGKDLKKQFNALPDFMKTIYNNAEGKKKLADELVKKELIYLEAKKQGLEQSPEYLEKLKEFQKLSLISMLLTKEIEEKAKVTEEDVKKYYDTHPDEFSTDRARASHILVSTKEEADSLLKKLKAGEDFAALAKKNSIDKGSAAKGGDLGFFGRGQMVPEFEKTVFSMKKGEISEPVKTQFGYHIIKLTDLEKGEKAGFDKVKESLSKKLLTEKRRAAFDSYIEKLKNSYKVEINEDKLKDLKLTDQK